MAEANKAVEIDWERWPWRADPAVPSFPDQFPLIIFDAECVLCSANAQFVLQHDRSGRFRLTTAQGELGQALYRHFGLSTSEYETMLLLEQGRVRRDSDGVIAIAEGLGWPWRAAGVLRLVPRALRDSLYRLVARNRYRLFGRRAVCWAPPPHAIDRIL
jgi:predicted DCC family thiol-disulfide oxidoreductase YuxK